MKQVKNQPTKYFLGKTENRSEPTFKELKNVYEVTNDGEDAINEGRIAYGGPAVKRPFLTGQTVKLSVKGGYDQEDPLHQELRAIQHELDERKRTFIFKSELQDGEIRQFEALIVNIKSDFAGGDAEELAPIEFEVLGLEAIRITPPSKPDKTNPDGGRKK